jgi:uncharacterized membrane protein YqjE
MTYTRIGFGFLGLVALVLVVLAFTSAPGLKAPIIAFVVLFVLVGAGNWLNHALGIKRKAQEFERPDRPGGDV